MSDHFLSPTEKHWTFWEESEVFDKEEFFLVPMKTERDGQFCASVGYFDGKNLVWMLEYYHVFGVNSPIFYIGIVENCEFNPSTDMMDDVTKEEWLNFAKEKTPQCFDWINFHLKDLGLI